MKTASLEKAGTTRDESFGRYHCQAPSDKRNLDGLIQKIVNFLNECNMTKPSGMTLVARELLLNAIVHGNECDERRRVKVDVVITGTNAFDLIVEDEGPGFDYTNLNVELPDTRACAERRGYMLINALSDGVEFNRRGNRVTAHFTPQARVTI